MSFEDLTDRGFDRCSRGLKALKVLFSQKNLGVRSKKIKIQRVVHPVTKPIPINVRARVNIHPVNVSFFDHRPDRMKLGRSEPDTADDDAGREYATQGV